MSLTKDRIDELAAKRGVRAIAVQNFLGSLGTLSKPHALANLEQDARLYCWNAPTIAAIRTGIRESFEPAAKPAKNKPIRAPRVDREWQRENAMQLGMGLGVEAYNDAMGYGGRDDE